MSKIPEMILQIAPFPGTSRNGSLDGLTQADLTRILGFEPITELSDKVTMTWQFTKAGHRCAIWDYKGSARDNHFSCFGNSAVLASIFGSYYTSDR